MTNLNLTIFDACEVGDAMVLWLINILSIAIPAPDAIGDCICVPPLINILSVGTIDVLIAPTAAIYTDPRVALCVVHNGRTTSRAV